MNDIDNYYTYDEPMAEWFFKAQTAQTIEQKKNLIAELEDFSEGFYISNFDDYPCQSLVDEQYLVGVKALLKMLILQVSEKNNDVDIYERQENIRRQAHYLVRGHEYDSIKEAWPHAEKMVDEASKD